MRRRTVLMLALFLLAGAAINVAMAWTISYAFPCDGGTSAVIKLGNEWWRASFGTRRAGAAGLYWSGLGSGDYRPRLEKAILLEPPNWSMLARQVTSQHRGMVEYAAGWPSLAMYGRFRDRNLDGRPLESSADHELAESSKHAVFTIGTHQIPLLPLWPGFAINTLFYAAVLWLLIRGSLTTRRRLRIRRGQCPACAYPVGASPQCTECGRPVTARASIANPT